MSDVPPLAERERPGLSETLTGPIAPDHCQSCGVAAAVRTDVDRVLERAGNAYPGLRRWIECDPWDQPTGITVVLCDRCTKRLIDPHPRLYRELGADEPRPGCMPFCADCRHRDGTRCTHPRAKANGGEGVRLGFERPPAIYHICGTRGGRRFGGWRRMYSPVTRCRQKEVHA